MNVWRQALWGARSALAGRGPERSGGDRTAFSGEVLTPIHTPPPAYYRCLIPVSIPVRAHAPAQPGGGYGTRSCTDRGRIRHTLLHG